MPFETLLSTKFYIPQPQTSLIGRPRLVEKLEVGTQHALTLVSAPAGFGKTTLLSNWVYNRNQTLPDGDGQNRAAWLSLDEEDDDPGRFWLYLFSTLHRSGIDLEDSVLPLLRVPQPPPIKSILILLINELERIKGDRVLILDDYHLIKAQSIHDGLSYLILHLPKQFHLILSTRADPPLPLSRLRVQNQLIEIRAADLLFTTSEAEIFLRETMGIILSSEALAALEARTEGWAAGLQLAGLSMRGMPDLAGFVNNLAGSQRHILDYLVDEVLVHLEPEVQSFLERTAILDQLCGSLCDWTVNGEDGLFIVGSSFSSSQGMLEELERSNLFLIPLDGERRWFRYHHLFAECLVARLRQNHPGLLPQLYRRASQWYERQGLFEEALHYRFFAQDPAWTAELLEKCIPPALEQGYLSKILRWKDLLPAEVISSSPRLCLLLAHSLAESSKFEQAETYLHIVEQALQTGAVLASEAPRWMIAGIRSIVDLTKGDVHATLKYSQEALADIPDNEPGWRGLVTLNQGYAEFLVGDLDRASQDLAQAFELGIQSGNLQVILSTPAYLTSVLIIQLQLSKAEEICQRALRIIAEKLGSATVSIPALCTLYTTLAKVKNERNELSGAEALTLKAVDLAGQSGSINAILIATIRLANLRMDQGRVQEGLEILSQKISLLREKKDLLRLSQAESALALFWVMAGKLQSAEQWVAGLPQEAFNGSGFIEELNNFVLMRLRCAQDRPVEALAIADRVLVSAQASGRVGRIFELEVFRSTLFFAAGDIARAFELLKQALILGQPENLLRTFLNEGLLMANMLERFRKEPGCVSNPVLREYVARILNEFTKEPCMQEFRSGPNSSNGSTADLAASISPNDRLVEPLTARELDILCLMSRGASNQEIAQALVISLGTVKAHTSHIQGKLGTHNRTETVVFARELGLIDKK
jgi:LuxR family transcriptional regulator, maltose regulon positive regulatory protein